MKVKSGRTERLHRLIDFARLYRSWSRVETARALGRDSTKLYPNTDNPKMDLLMGLARVLDWSVDDVVEYIWSGDAEDVRARNGADFDALDAQAREAHCAGDFRRMVEIARHMYCVAESPEQRARACNREHGGWDGLGRFTKALEAACRGLREHAIPMARYHQLQTNLANTHYTLWELASARAHANAVIEWYDSHPPEEAIDCKNQAFAYYVRGHTYRRLAATQPEHAEPLLLAGKSDLETCARLYTELARRLGDKRLEAIAHTCRGGILEIDVGLGLCAPREAVNQYAEALEAVVDPDKQPAGDWLESYGWWSIFGANTALQHLSGRPLQHYMAVFTNKALEIAERMDNWAFRERVFSMQFDLHEKLVDESGLDIPYVLDDEDKRLITGTMGRFPAFRDTGWRIFRAANVIENSTRN